MAVNMRSEEINPVKAIRIASILIVIALLAGAMVSSWYTVQSGEKPLSLHGEKSRMSLVKV